MSDNNQRQDPDNPNSHGGQDEPSPYDDTKDAGVASALDRQRISPKSGREIQELRRFVDEVVEREGERGEGGAGLADLLTEWRRGVLEDLPPYEIEEEDEDERIERAYTVFPLESSSGGRTYRAQVHIDNAFGSLIERVRQTIQLMLDRVVVGRAACFIETAVNSGLTWRRSRSLPFPHPLPYMSPPPTTLRMRAMEEVGVIEAAFRFPLSQAAPGIKLLINQFSQGPSSGGFWVLGSATVNLYNDINGTRFLRIRLNSRAYPQFSDNTWAGTIAHEVMHNLGWGHPNGVYQPQIAIVNYDRCIRRDERGFVEEIDDSKQIR